MISTVGQNDNMTKVKLSEFPSQKELMERELEARSRGTLAKDVLFYHLLDISLYRYCVFLH